MPRTDPLPSGASPLSRACYNFPMKDRSGQKLSPALWRTGAALSFVLITTTLMNVAVFPRFDAVFTYARDLSVLANSITLIAVGLAATFRPALLPVKHLNAACVSLLALGAVLLPFGLYEGDAVALTAASSLLAVGRGWLIVVVGVAASRLTLRQASIAVAVSFVVQYAAAAVIWVIPVVAGTALFLLLPFLAFALVRKQAYPILDETQHGEAPADFSVTQPSSFLPLASQLFVCLFLFRVAFGYSLRFGEVAGVPLSDALGILPVAAVALYVLLARKPLPADVLAQVSVLLIVAGFLVAPSGASYAAFGSVTLLSAGNAVFDMVAWLVLIAVAGRNTSGAVATFAWGRGVSGLGTVVGAGLGVWSNDLFGFDDVAVSLLAGAIILVFVGYSLLGLKNFSFSATIDGVTQVEETVVQSPEQEFEERCASIASQNGLSPRELEVFMMLARGRDRSYIQEKLVVSRNTVKAHVKHVYAKLGIHAHQDLIDLVEGTSHPANPQHAEGCAD